MVSLQTAIFPAEEEEEEKKPCIGLESRTVSRKRKSSAAEASKSAKKLAREEEGGSSITELNLLDAHPEIKWGWRHYSKVDPKAMKVSLNLDLELNLSCTPSKKTGCAFEGGEEERRTTEEEEEEMVAAVCLRCHMLVMMTKVALLCPNCKFVHSPDQSSSLALIKSIDLGSLCHKD